MTLLNKQDGSNNTLYDKISRNPYIVAAKDTKFSLSISSEFSVSDGQHYFRTVLLNIFMTLCNLTFNFKQIHKKLFVSKRAFWHTRYAYLDILRNRISNGVVFGVVGMTNSIMDISIESIKSRHDRSRARVKFIYCLSFIFPIGVYKFFPEKEILRIGL